MTTAATASRPSSMAASTAPCFVPPAAPAWADLRVARGGRRQNAEGPPRWEHSVRVDLTFEAVLGDLYDYPAVPALSGTQDSRIAWSWIR